MIFELLFFSNKKWNFKLKIKKIIIFLLVLHIYIEVLMVFSIFYCFVFDDCIFFCKSYMVFFQILEQNRKFLLLLICFNSIFQILYLLFCYQDCRRNCLMCIEGDYLGFIFDFQFLRDLSSFLRSQIFQDFFILLLFFIDVIEIVIIKVTIFINVIINFTIISITHSILPISIIMAFINSFIVMSLTTILSIIHYHYLY